VQGIVKISIEEYIRRGFQHLCVNFGCTGGQHRSVYNAQKFARWVQNNYAVKVVLHHIEIEKSNNEQNQM
jgi:RNase adaptor protein for sRNA GlmZ degradation